MPRVSAAMVAEGRTLAEPRLSPDGTRLAFLATQGGVARIVVVDLDGAGPEVVVTTDPPPIPTQAYGGGAFDWIADGSGLVYAAVDGGLWRQPASGGPPRRLAIGGAPAAAPAVSPDGRLVAFVVDTRHVAVASTDPDGPWPIRLTTGADFALDPAWSPDGRSVVWHEWDVPDMPWDGSRIVVRDADASGEAKVVGGGPGIAVSQPRFSAAGTLGFLDDRSGFANVVAGDARIDDDCEHGGPTWGPGERSWCWSPDGRSVLFTRNEEGFGSLNIHDLTTGERRRLGRAAHGGLSWARIARGGAPVDRIAAIRSGGITPTSVVVYDGDDRRVVARGPVAGFEGVVTEPELVRWPATDGAELYGRLYRPTREVHGTPPPLICWVHGGPTGQWDVQFRARFAYWTERGWAVLVPDHRGSSGHGRAFRQALSGRWGELDVDDCAAGLRAAADRGWGDPARFVVMGGSAGGFTVLNLLATHPDLCAAGVDLFGVADLFDLDETTHRYEAHYLHTIVGALPEAADRYHERSPVNRAEAITSPLLILQGDADKVVPLAQSQAIFDRLRSLGRPVELHVYEGEGHGWGRPATVVDELERTESFLRRYVLRGHR
ncbi:MAG TPA: S9 family peptidase [Acidimicrobiales bacterium]|nr:S9 family peptidase [Acidimicrobiales bacterium]